MLDNLTNALNKTIKAAGGMEVLTGTVIQAQGEPIWYVTFTTSAGALIEYEVIWRDGGIVASVLNKFKMTELFVAKITTAFLDKIELPANGMPPLYEDDYSDMPPLET